VTKALTKAQDTAEWFQDTAEWWPLSGSEINLYSLDWHKSNPSLIMHGVACGQQDAAAPCHDWASFKVLFCLLSRVVLICLTASREDAGR